MEIGGDGDCVIPFRQALETEGLLRPFETTHASSWMRLAPLPIVPIDAAHSNKWCLLKSQDNRRLTGKQRLNPPSCMSTAVDGFVSSNSRIKQTATATHSEATRLLWICISTDPDLVWVSIMAPSVFVRISYKIFWGWSHQFGDRKTTWTRKFECFGALTISLSAPILCNSVYQCLTGQLLTRRLDLRIIAEGRDWVYPSLSWES